MPETTLGGVPADRGSDWQRQYAAVARAIAFIRANAVRQPELAEIAAAANLSEYHLQRLFSAWAGLSPKRFLQYLTKEHALTALFGWTPRGVCHLAFCVDDHAAKLDVLHNDWPASLVSYGRLAAHLGQSRAARAVGSAVAANTIAWLIPCHRVIREDGDRSNYRWGAERKLALHAWEARRVQPAV